ncbi:hypothetical protein I5M27_02415 [Adhaeribacter sp. BT258]|uniref:Uncharacterized protein n=1 Tax=Adhaeribacter terrigena TaxID=2793070 RepID=A0ABS1BXN6_9BACT|nr:hypothetical protein [Adhaeribacter terrigena]MBK0401819.1 hypothetical protein [Adhaeribacter terrigena]
MKLLKRIKKQRKDTNSVFKIHYSCTAKIIDGEWNFEMHESRSISGHLLLLKEKWPDHKEMNYDFGIYKYNHIGELVIDEKVSLSVLYNLSMKKYYATLCIEKTKADIRKEKILNIIND